MDPLEVCAYGANEALPLHDTIRSTYRLKAHVREMSTPPKLTFLHGRPSPYFSETLKECEKRRLLKMKTMNCRVREEVKAMDTKYH